MNVSLNKRNPWFFLIALGAFFFPLSTLGQTNPPKAVEVFADHFELDLNTKTSLFSKNVKIYFEDYQARCSQAVVYM